MPSIRRFPRRLHKSGADSRQIELTAIQPQPMKLQRPPPTHPHCRKTAASDSPHCYKIKIVQIPKPCRENSTASQSFLDGQQKKFCRNSPVGRMPSAYPSVSIYIMLKSSQSPTCCQIASGYTSCFPKIPRSIFYASCVPSLKSD